MVGTYSAADRGIKTHTSLAERMSSVGSLSRTAKDCLRLMRTSWAGVAETIVAQISPRAGIVGAIALRTIRGGIGLSLAVGDGAADDRARCEAAERGCAGAVMAMMVPVAIPVTMPMAMSVPVLHLLHAGIGAGS